MRFSEVFRSSDNQLDKKSTDKKRSANEMYNGDYDYGNLDPIPSNSNPLHKKRREGGTSDSSVKFDWVPRNELGTQGHIASNARIDGMRRNKEDIGRGIDMAGRVPARDRREYELKAGAGSDSESEVEPVELTSEEWGALKTDLLKIKDAFDTFKGKNAEYREFRAANHRDLINNYIGRGYTVREVSVKIAKKLNEKQEAVNEEKGEVNRLLENFREAVEKHKDADICHPDDYYVLTKLARDMPESGDDPTFMLSINTCKDLIKTAQGESESESESESD